MRRPTAPPDRDPLALALALRDAPLGATVRALRTLHERRERERRAAAGLPAPGRGDRYDGARRRFYAHFSRERERAALAPALAEQLLPARPEAGDEIGAALRGIQELVLRHPAAMQEAFAALVAEGRCFARTPEGRRWQERLADSAWIQRARLVWKMASLSALEEHASAPLPSAWLDGLFLAAARDPDGVLDRLFGGGNEP
jgi:hypothetical protein